MRSIGVRELRQNASRYLRLVEAGETVQVTDRGRPVALLVPPPARGGYDHLVATGRVRQGNGNLLSLGPPPPGRPGEIPLSEVLEDMRADER